MLSWMSSWIWTEPAVVEAEGVLEEGPYVPEPLPVWSGSVENLNVFVLGKRACGKSTLVEKVLAPKADKISEEICSNAWALNTWINAAVRKQMESLKFKTITTEVVKLEPRQLAMHMPHSKNRCFENLFINSRHYSMGILVEAQSMIDIPHSIRANADMVFVFNNSFNLYRNSPVPEWKLDEAFGQLEKFECLAWFISGEDKKIYRVPAVELNF